ncbi:MAG: sensor histidine kinase [Clostridiaceae bacterium]|nr:sensor histidine kinase [Clostridiaceae bacterium]
MKKIKTRFTNRFYNKLMLLNTGIICVVTLIYGIIAFINAINYERVMHLKTCEDTLNQLHASYHGKQENYTNLMYTFYEDSTNFNAISTLLENDSYSLSALDPFDLQRITMLLSSLCNKDSDIHSIFIYKANTKTLYAYNPGSSIIKMLNSDSPFYQDLAGKDLRRTIHSAVNVSFLENNSTPVFAYGIGGNISTANISFQKKPGSVMVAYNISGLERTLQNRGLQFPARFMILTFDGKVIFDSEKKLSESPDGTEFMYMDKLQNSSGLTEIEKTKYYFSSIKDEKRGYMTLYLVPKNEVDKTFNYFSVVIIIGSVTFMGLSVSLYILSSRLSTKRIGMLEEAMTQIGSNNLSYRIPRSRRTDEFSFIAERFNEMCDELEDKVNKVYIYDLKQKSAELYALQASINPHFLYNTLEAIRGRLAMDGNIDAAEMVVLLSKLYRNQIKGKMFITLREEISQCNIYLELFSIRYDGNFQCSFDLPPEIMKYGIPKNTLQPILENYLVHGIREKNNRVWITGEIHDGVIEITVRDNGRGINPDTLRKIRQSLKEFRETSSTGFGLSNVNERLRIVYGPEFGLSIQSSEETPGTSVTVRIKALFVEELEKHYQAKTGGFTDV